MKIKTRETTTRLIELCQQGVLDPMSVLESALQCMSEDDVSDMAYSEGFLNEEDEEEEDTDFDDTDVMDYDE